MYLKYALLFLCSASLMYTFKVRISFKTIKAKLANKIISMSKVKKKLTAKQYIEELEGKDKRNYLQRNKDAAFNALERSGRGRKYKKTLLLSKILSASSFVLCLVIGNFVLAPVLAIGLYFIPLWATKLYVFRYDKFVREELETALSLITTSYIRHNDLHKAIEENIAHINNPVAAAFRQFLQGLKFVSANIASELETLSGKIDNKVFKKWCDTIILCQEDHTLKATLLPIVSKFSDIKAQQSENETNMMLPIKEIVFMSFMVISPIPILYAINRDWFEGLVFSLPGQVVISIAATWVFISINKAILLCSPIEYDV